MTTPKKVFLALFALAVVQAVHYYPQLPETMATHFNGAGHPDGWSSRAEFFAIMFGMMILMGGVFLGIPKTLSRTPDGWISLPYRDYWLSKDRRAETMRFIDRQSSWFGVATLLLILASVQFTIEANLQPHPELPDYFMWVFWAYMGFTVVWTVHFVAHFARIRKHQSAT